MQLQRAVVVVTAALWSFAWAAPQAAGEELLLTNGQKIVGTIVGYENDMFRVQTDFGIALVRKDKVVSVQINPPASRDSLPKKGKGNPAGPTSAGAKPEAAPKAAPAEAASEASLAPAKPLAPPPPPVSRPVDEPLPAHLQEHVEGNTYVNDTFQFAMYKPPGWKVYEGVPGETGSGIMAMGTEDEQTLLIVDRQVWSGTPDLKNNQIEARLRHTYQDYKKLTEESVQFDSHPAIRRAFQGVLDGAEWHGTAVHVARGNTVFGILGLTSAETFGFQQAIFSKIISSFHFMPPSPAPASQPSAKTTP